MESAILVALTLVLVAAVAYCIRHPAPLAAVSDGSPMPAAWRWVLVAYLLACGVVLINGLVIVASIDFPDSGVDLTAERPAAPAQASAGDSSALTLTTVVPQTTVGSAPTEFLTLIGRNIPDSATVRVNTAARMTSVVVRGIVLTAQLQAADFSKTLLLVDIAAGDQISNAIAVQVSKPRMPLLFGPWQRPISREQQLLLLALLAGALGSFLHAIKSLTDFIGNRTLTASWFWWYITRPLLGMAMALIFYSLLRGGFLAGTPADAKIVNPFGVIAVCALVGMFADKAADKLAEIFDTLFKADDKRSDKLIRPVVERLEPDTVSAGTASATIHLIGDRLDSVAKVRVGTTDHKPDSVSPKDVQVTCTAADLANVGTVSIVAITADGTASPTMTLRITDLKITALSPADAKVGAVYSHALTASGGKTPYKFSLKNPPAWLTVDNAGALQGTPSAAGPVAFSIVVRDADGTTIGQSVKLTVVA